MGLGEHKLDVLRLTTDFYNYTDDKLQSELREQVKLTPEVDLWGSIPCTAWSTWQHMSLHTQGPEYAERLRKARLQSRKILLNFVKLAGIVIEGGGRVAIECPRYATGWRLAELQNFIIKYDLCSSNFEGCGFGMQDDKGVPIYKPWRVVTSCVRLANSLEEHRCRHEVGFKHAKVQGSLTAKTASYPRAMCQCVAAAWYQAAVHGNVPVMCCVPCSDNDVPAMTATLSPQRRKEHHSVGFADIPYFMPTGIVFEGLDNVFALPADPEDAGEVELPPGAELSLDAEAEGEASETALERSQSQLT